MRFFEILWAFTAAVTLLPCFSFAQGETDYPTKPVRVIVAAAAGGAIDTLTRMLAHKLSENLRRQFVVDNRAGGGGTPAYGLVAKSAPDGYTLLFTAGRFTYGQALYPDFPDPIKDFAPIAQASQAPYLLAAYPALPAISVKEVIALAKSKPGGLNMGVTQGGFTHLATAYFASAANIKVTIIPYKGSEQIMVDTIAGRGDIVFANVLSTLPHVKSGKLRALAVSTAKRSVVLPELPTVSESGLPGYNISGWFGWLAPAGTPLVIVNKLSAEIVKVVRSADVVKNLAQDGGEAVGSTPEEFQKFISREVVLWGKVIKDSGMRVE